jgi:hypothetical protein
MTEQKFTIPTEMIDLPSQGKVYAPETELASGKVEMKYMTAKEEDILTNMNLLRKGTAIEEALKSLIKSPIKYEDMLIGDRNGLMIAARILGYGKDYTFKYTNPRTSEQETIKIDLQDLKYKEIDLELFTNSNEFEFELPFSKNVVTFKLLTVGDDRKIDEEIKGLKKSIGTEAGLISTRLKYQLLSINGDRSVKAIRDFVDQGYLLAKDAIELRRYIAKITPDIDTSITFTTNDGTEVEMDMPMTAEFFFPGSGL